MTSEVDKTGGDAVAVLDGVAVLDDSDKVSCLIAGVGEEVDKSSIGKLVAVTFAVVLLEELS